jgi:hypothetical protein
MTIVNAYLNDEAGQDVVVNNSRVRATNTPITVGTITFPAAPLGINYIDGIGTPISSAPGATTTLLAEQLLTGIMTLAPSTACTATFDSAANIVAGVNAVTAGAAVGDVITCLICNGTSATTITLAVPASGAFDTHQANTAITGGTSKYVFVRLTNVIPGSQAYVVYF